MVKLVLHAVMMISGAVLAPFVLLGIIASRAITRDPTLFEPSPEQRGRMEEFHRFTRLPSPDPARGGRMEKPVTQAQRSRLAVAQLRSIRAGIAAREGRFSHLELKGFRDNARP